MMRDTLSQSDPSTRAKGSRSMHDAEKTGTEPQGTGANILLIEDDETLAALLARVLRNEGYHVDLLERADALPSPAKIARYDVVLSDIHLAGGTSGHDVLRTVRKATETVPVILMTAYADVE